MLLVVLLIVGLLAVFLSLCCFIGFITRTIGVGTGAFTAVICVALQLLPPTRGFVACDDGMRMVACQKRHVFHPLAS